MTRKSPEQSPLPFPIKYVPLSPLSFSFVKRPAAFAAAALRSVPAGPTASLARAPPIPQALPLGIKVTQCIPQTECGKEKGENGACFLC